MEQKDKELLLQDLCARLPYGVKFKWCDNFHTDDYYTLISINEGQFTGRDVNQDDCLFFWGQDKIKPYLRPMSSMTEEEREFLNRMALENSLKCIEEEDPQKVFLLRVKQDVEELAYLYKHHYDVNGLIPSGHAIEVTDENNPYKD
jgi:hypothetical protein